MNQFVERMKALESEINALKTASLIGTTSLTTTSKTIQMHVDLEYKLYPSGLEDVQSKKRGIITIIPEENDNFISSIELISGQSQVKNRRCFLQPYLGAGEKAFSFEVVNGSLADIATMRNGGQISFDLTFRVTCSSDFSLNLTYEDPSWTSGS